MSENRLLKNDRVDWTQSLELPEPSLLILAACPDDARWLRRAIWAFDVLRNVDRSLQLIIPNCPCNVNRIKLFAQQLAFDDNRVTFLSVPFCEEWFTWADVIWYASDQGKHPTNRPGLFSLESCPPVDLAIQTYSYLVQLGKVT